MTRPFCAYPFFHQLIETTGNALPCCAWGASIKSNINYKDYFNSEWNKQLREKMLHHEIPEGCAACVENDAHGGWSNRRQANKIAERYEVDFDNPVLMFEEVDLSNICNLRCRMCDGSKSSKMIKDDSLFHSPLGYNRPVYKKQESHWELSEENAETIRFLRFLGGEPLLHQEQILDALEKIKRKGRLNKVGLSINTNLTVLPSDRILELSDDLHFIDFTVSMEGYGKLNEYIRSDSNWETLIKNLNIIIERKQKEKVKHSFHVGILTVAQILNCNKLHELYEFFETLPEDTVRITQPIKLVEPKFYAVQNLPDTAKEKLRVYYDECIDKHPKFAEQLTSAKLYLDAPRTLSEEDWRTEFLYGNNLFDSTRMQKLADYNPELLDLLDL